MSLFLRTENVYGKNWFQQIIIQTLVMCFLSTSANAQVASLSHGMQGNIMAISPSDIFADPAILQQVWVDAPVPVEYYSDDDIRQQQLINVEITDAIVSYSPVGDEFEWKRTDYEDITPFTWKWVYLQVRHNDGLISEVSLRRPNWWIKQNNLDKVGNVTRIDLDEIDMHGSVTVTEVAANQLDTRFWNEERNGDYVNRPIIGKFIHTSDNVYDLTFDNASPLGITGEHPVWSYDREGWVHANELLAGEKVSTYFGISTLVKSEKREGLHKVYNVEVYRSHNYFVSPGTILVHNAPCKEFIGFSDVHTNTHYQGSHKVFYTTGAGPMGSRKYFVDAVKRVNDGSSQFNLREFLQTLEAEAVRRGEKSLIVRINVGTDSGINKQGLSFLDKNKYLVLSGGSENVMDVRVMLRPIQSYEPK